LVGGIALSEVRKASITIEGGNESVVVKKELFFDVTRTIRIRSLGSSVSVIIPGHIETLPISVHVAHIHQFRSSTAAN
jgi:hypothetical protein